MQSNFVLLLSIIGAVVSSGAAIVIILNRDKGKYIPELIRQIESCKKEYNDAVSHGHLEKLPIFTIGVLRNHVDQCRSLKKNERIDLLRRLDTIFIGFFKLPLSQRQQKSLQEQLLVFGKSARQMSSLRPR